MLPPYAVSAPSERCAASLRLPTEVSGGASTEQTLGMRRGVLTCGRAVKGWQGGCPANNEDMVGNAEILPAACQVYRLGSYVMPRQIQGFAATDVSGRGPRSHIN